jgi:hypothetical protein
MDLVEQRLADLLERLARENRQVLAMLRLGYSLKQAETILAHAKTPRAPGKAAQRDGLGL